jgi:hypothetical protein
VPNTPNGLGALKSIRSTVGPFGITTAVIARGYFSLVALNFTDTTGLDRQISADLRHYPHYHVVQVVPYGMEIPLKGQGSYLIWQYQASTKQTGYTPNR